MYTKRLFYPLYKRRYVMHSDTVLVLTGDKRQLYLFNYLIENDCKAIYYDNTNFTLNVLIKMCNIIVCPTPFTKDGRTVNFTGSNGKTPVYINDFLNMLNSDHKVFGFGFPKYFTDECFFKNITLFDFADNLELIGTNGLYTAEGVIGNIIMSTPFSINEANCLITGFGTCGFHIADMLNKLGADVCIYDINSEKQDKAVSLGYTTFDLLKNRNLSGFNIIINTVPKNIFNSDNTFNDACYIFDISSAPYGFDDELWNSLYHAVRLPGIPGKLMPKSAGILLGKTVFSFIK